LHAARHASLGVSQGPVGRPKFDSFLTQDDAWSEQLAAHAEVVGIATTTAIANAIRIFMAMPPDHFLQRLVIVLPLGICRFPVLMQFAMSAEQAA
jgi:hypothetical protein